MPDFANFKNCYTFLSNVSAILSDFTKADFAMFVKCMLAFFSESQNVRDADESDTTNAFLESLNFVVVRLAGSSGSCTWRRPGWVADQV